VPDIVFDIRSDAPLWVRSARNLASSIREMEPRQSERPGHTITTLGANEFFELAYADATRFVIDGDAKHLWGASPRPLSAGHLAIYLQGPLMGFVLRLRGVTALHASAVCINGRAVVLCGPREAGKSTTAAALALRGVPVLCDDIATINEKNEEFQMESGCPRICLWPDAVLDLLGSPDALPRLIPAWEKCFLPLDGSRARFEPNKQPVGAIYLLAPRGEQTNAPRVEDLSSREALLELVKNTYMNWLLDRRQRAAEFNSLSKLVSQVPVRRIVPHPDPRRIGALCDLIADDVQRLIVRTVSTVVSTG